MQKIQSYIFRIFALVRWRRLAIENDNSDDDDDDDDPDDDSGENDICDYDSDLAVLDDDAVSDDDD